MVASSIQYFPSYPSPTCPQVHLVLPSCASRVPRKALPSSPRAFIEHIQFNTHLPYSPGSPQRIGLGSIGHFVIHVPFLAHSSSLTNVNEELNEYIHSYCLLSAVPTILACKLISPIK